MHTPKRATLLYSVAHHLYVAMDFPALNLPFKSSPWWVFSPALHKPEISQVTALKSETLVKVSRIRQGVSMVCWFG